MAAVPLLLSFGSVPKLDSLAPCFDYYTWLPLFPSCVPLPYATALLLVILLVDSKHTLISECELSVSHLLFGSVCAPRQATNQPRACTTQTESENIVSSSATGVFSKATMTATISAAWAE